MKLWLLDRLLGESGEVGREAERAYADMWPKHDSYDERNKQVLREVVIRARRDMWANRDVISSAGEVVGRRDEHGVMRPVGVVGWDGRDMLDEKGRRALGAPSGDGMNLLFSYGAKKDHELAAQGHAFLGAGYDERGVEAHVFQRRTT